MNDAAAKLRVLTFIHSFEPGGVERIALRLCREWAFAEASVTLAVGRMEGRLLSELPGVPIICATARWFPRSMLETLWMLLWLPGIVRRLQPDIIFCPGNSYTIVAVALRWWLGGKCPPIVTKVSNDLCRFDLPQPLRAFYHLWCRIQGRWIDHFVAMSQPMRFEIVRTMRISRQRVSSIYDPVLDTETLHRLAKATASAASRSKRGRRFLAVGRLVRQKNFLALIDAFASASSEDDLLIIAGDGPLRRKLAARVAELGLTESVRLTGHVDDVLPIMSASDFLIVPSLFEGVPAALIEGLAAGLQPIATDCCVTMRELVIPTGGRLIPTGDIEALAAAIAVAIPDRAPDPRRTHVASLHCARLSASQYMRLLHHLVAMNPRLSQPCGAWRLDTIRQAPGLEPQRGCNHWR